MTSIGDTISFTAKIILYIKTKYKWFSYIMALQGFPTNITNLKKTTWLQMAAWLQMAYRT